MCAENSPFHKGLVPKANWIFPAFCFSWLSIFSPRVLISKHDMNLHFLNFASDSLFIFISHHSRSSSFLLFPPSICVWTLITHVHRHTHTHTDMLLKEPPWTCSSPKPVVYFSSLCWVFSIWQHLCSGILVCDRL